MEQLEDRAVPHTGAGVAQFAIPTADSAPTGIVFSPSDGNFWFTEFAADQIGRITTAGVITEFTLPAGRGPLNITVGPDGNLWFTSNTGDRIGRINPLAGSDADIQASLIEFVVPDAGSAPGDIVTGPDGALWFTQTGSNQIGRITTAGVVTDEFAVPGADSAPGGITVGPDGALWFTQAVSGEIGRLTLAGVFTEFVIPVPSGGVSDPEDIVAGPDNALYFTDFGRDQIGRISTAGQITQFDLQAGRGPQQIIIRGTELTFTEAASGRIGALQISALQPGSTPTTGSHSQVLTEFDRIRANSVPVGIAAGPNNTFWFALNAENAIGTFVDIPAPPPPPAPLPPQITVAATGPVVQVFDRQLNELRSFLPFPGYQGQLSVTVQDFNGNGTPDAVVAIGSPGAPFVVVYEGSDNSVLASFFAFSPFVPAFSTGLTLAADDVNGDGRADLVVASGTLIKVIDGTKLGQIGPDGQIADSALLGVFFAFAPGTMDSVSLTCGDLNRDGRAEVIVGAGRGASPLVRVIDGTKVNQIRFDSQVADGALLANFFAFSPLFTGGVSVAVAFNARRDLVVGAGPGSVPLVKVLDGTKLGEVGFDGSIADSATVASFLAFPAVFSGGVHVAADDIDGDGQAEIIIGSGPGIVPVVRVIDGARTGQVGPDGVIAPEAVISTFLTALPFFTGGVNIASDADHRDGPVFGPPGITVTNSRRDINDMFIFRSPVNADNTVMAMNVSPFAGATTPNIFDPGVLYDFRIANRDLVNTTDDVTFRVVFSNPDAQGIQDVSVRALPAARFPGTGGVIVKGLTRENIPVRGVGGTGAMFRAAPQDDPFLFDAVGFNALLNNPNAVQGVVDGEFPRGTGTFGPGGTPNYDADNFFGPNVNTLSIVLEVPSARITGPLGNTVGFWGRTEFGGVQIDRMGRPAINTALIPPVPRGADFPIEGTADPNRQDRRNAFNAGHPRDDRTNFGTDMVSVLTAFYPIGRPTNGADPAMDAAQAGVVANLLLPDILVFDVTSSDGFFQDTVGTLGQPDFFLAGGRKFSDDVVSIEVSILTDADTPFGPNPPALVTQNVADDNGLNLMDGSMVGPGSPLFGMVRDAVFPYIGAPNPNPDPVPGTPPPP